ncbi:hypothetical protein JW916_13810 [Candidatus Sumerlaeota bacterium]|nr:hypothetical protein [Candidatus Sumerlaeota bacterium]
MNATTQALLDLQVLEFAKETRNRIRRRRERACRAVARLRRRIPIQVLREYDTRKRRFGSNSLVPVEGDICSGCRVALSRRTLHDSSVRPTECEHCARLLYNPTRRRRLRLEIYGVPMPLELAG